MPGNAAEVFGAVSKYISSDLMGEDNKNHLFTILKYFPEYFFTLFGFETNLNHVNKSLDTAFCIKPDQAAGFHNFLQTSESGKLLKKNPLWEKIEEFIRQLIFDGGSLQHHNIESIWLEFDEKQGNTDIPVPLFFFQMNTLSHENDWIIKLIGHFIGSNLTSHLIHLFDNCYRSLTGEMKLKYVGILTARNNKLIRLCFCGLAPAVLLKYLEKIGLSACFNELSESIKLINGLSDRIELLHIDISDHIIPKIGLEYRFNNEFDDNMTGKWQNLFSFLVKNKLALPDKCRALLDWNGKSREILDKNLYKYFTVRYLHYIKALIRPEQPIEFKAYFMVKNLKIIA